MAMIAFISGKIIQKELNFVILETGGLGYRVSITQETSSIITTSGKKIADLWVHTSVREDSWNLYGFLSQEELVFFETLINIPNIGPKTALGVMNTSPLQNLKNAISEGDIIYLTKISGIGKKVAEKIIFELKEKIIGNNTNMISENDSDTIDALTSLGYKEREAREAIKKLSKHTLGTSNRVKEALKILGEKK